MSAGLAWVATYKAPECEKGRSRGFPSAPYPPEMARRLDHASKAAAPCAVNAKAYQAARCRGVSRGRANAGFTGFIGIVGPGSMTAALSASVFTFGWGTEGRVVEREESAAVGAFAALVVLASFTTAAGRFATALATSPPLCGNGQSKTRVASSIVHLANCESKFIPKCKQVKFSAPRGNRHWPIGHIFIGTAPWFFWSLVLWRFGTRLYAKNFLFPGITLPLLLAAKLQEFGY